VVAWWLFELVGVARNADTAGIGGRQLLPQPRLLHAGLVVAVAVVEWDPDPVVAAAVVEAASVVGPWEETLQRDGGVEDGVVAGDDAEGVAAREEEHGGGDVVDAAWDDAANVVAAAAVVAPLEDDGADDAPKVVALEHHSDGFAGSECRACPPERELHRPRHPYSDSEPFAFYYSDFDWHCHYWPPQSKLWLPRRPSSQPRLLPPWRLYCCQCCPCFYYESSSESLD